MKKCHMIYVTYMQQIILDEVSQHKLYI